MEACRGSCQTKSRVLAGPWGVSGEGHVPALTWGGGPGCPVHALCLQVSTWAHASCPPVSMYPGGMLTCRGVDLAVPGPARVQTHICLAPTICQSCPKLTECMSFAESSRQAT